MCSIAMPAELMLGHSPPAYSHHLLYGHHHHHHHHRPLMVNPPQPVGQRISNSTRSVPPRIRPCLSSGAILEDGIRNNDGDAARKSEAVAAAIARRKKRVVFADDRGRPLTQIRVMSEPSNVPPMWTSAFLAGVTRGIRWGDQLQEENERQQQQQQQHQAEVESSGSQWEMSFVQPASDYLVFRRKLDEEAVSLENVILREAEQCLIGTIKVKNLAYEKEVIVRVSSDGWASHEDVHCTYVEQPSSVPQAALVLYDTFRFRLTLPLKSDHVEFCVRYRVARTSEYWDSNGGKNYVLRKRHDYHHHHHYHHHHRQNLRRTVSLNDVGSSIISNGTIFDGKASLCQSDRGITRIMDATRANVVTWSEFASWQHINNDAPYW